MLSRSLPLSQKESKGSGDGKLNTKFEGKPF